MSTDEHLHMIPGIGVLIVEKGLVMQHVYINCALG